MKERIEEGRDPISLLGVRVPSDRRLASLRCRVMSCMDSGDTWGIMKSLGRLCDGIDVIDDRRELTLLDLREEIEGRLSCPNPLARFLEALYIALRERADGLEGFAPMGYD